MGDDWLKSLSSEMHRMQGNSPISLNDAGVVRIVHSGSLALFGIAAEHEKPVSARRPLFTVHAGEALFSCSIKDKRHALIALPLEETLLATISTENFVGLCVQGEARAAECLKSWIQKLNLSLEGSAVLSMPEIGNPESLLRDINNLGGEFLDRLGCIEERDTEKRSILLRERKQLIEHTTHDVLNDLASVVRGEQYQPVSGQGSSFFMAAHAVGQAAGITIAPPKHMNPDTGIKEAVKAIERSSRIRTRRVVLNGVWWKSDCGPLLAFKHENGQPVALLPRGPRRYFLFDPVSDTRLPVNRSVASGLQLFAYTFYRPFPDKIQGPMDILSFGFKGIRRDTVFILAAALAGTLLGMFTPIATSILIDEAIPDSDRFLLWQLGIGLLAAAFGKAFFDVSQGFATTRASTISIAATQSAVWDRLLKLRPSFLRRYSSGDLSTRAMAISTIYRRLSSITLRTLFSSLVSLLNLGLMFYYSSRLALIGMVAGLLIGLITLSTGSAILKKVRPLQQMGGKIMGLTIQLINGVSKLRVSGAEKFAFACWGKQFSLQQKLSISVQRFRDQVGVLNQTVPVLASAWIFMIAGDTFLGTNALGSDGLSVGAFLAFNAAFGIFVGGIASLSNTLVDTLNDFSLWKRAEPIMRAAPESDPGKTDPGFLTGRIEMDHVTFRYRDSGPLTLDDVSFHAEPGEFVAFVGPSGSGKSTIFRLLLGFELPQTGTVFYDGQDLNGMDVFAVRRQLGVVLQNSSLLAGSIFENIGAGTPITLEQAWKAARQAGIAADIASFPMGMHTFIAEGASNISVGQRQRLLIARALVFSPRILLFDEATSALDNQAQATISHSLSQLNVTRIVIAHRLSTIRNADRIYVMAGGRIVQQGSFKTISAGEGIFSRMMSRQML